MPIAARWRRLDRLPPARRRDPEPGVYELADAEKRVIYIGQSAVDVPNRLRQHLAAGGCVAERVAYWRSTYSRVPQADEATLLAVHRARHGDVPECNRAVPKVRDATRRHVERSRGR